MKKFFLISLMALTCGVMANAERVSLSVNGLGVSLADNMQFELQAPASLNLGTLTINAEVNDPLLVDAPSSREVTLQTGLNSSIDLKQKLNNVFGFGGTQMVVSVKADGASQAFLYDFTREGNVISATPTDAAAAAWALALSQVIKGANEFGEDSYLKIAAGSYLQLGGKKLQFTDIEMMKGNWGMESLRVALDAATSVDLDADNANVLFIAKGSEFAIGGRVATAKENVTMTLENNATFVGDLEDLKDAMGESAEDVIKAFVDLANAFIGYIDEAEVNYLTINIGEQALQPEDAEAPATGVLTSIRSGLNAGCFYTVCLPYGVDSYEGGTFYEIEGLDGDNLVLISVNALAPGFPYVVVPTGSEVRGRFNAQKANAAQNKNGLFGTFVNMKVPYGDGNYVFTDHSYNPCGSKCYLAANRAYIHMGGVPAISGNPAPGRQRLVVGANNAPTSIDEVAVENIEGTKKMMIDGQLIIVRDGVMYNAQGAVVK